ncbi:MAG: phospholipase C, phosphocholine-specific [Alphaproteobacteria bacterium]|uniref:phosphocholine-specific phospholipase C n=1 Tax=Brevundimonas sp. TaxID=1871086 RepID=UPI001DD27706|nr:phospholipase C, phosphocholine-specific [Alphaproteobacteria bacterium]MBU1521733.1 phospholipase C, phosphocholine-specific [Alphaproteobacteria bacterium]MBU2030369.1 phospholipase C, phosphocholine-specific [Alphaproteobacteria bacterium]MBU2166120.1 phospholipase C, phosphocholine-specific [Alphaproteobacteria bacterium]MBU2231023.1 phospholipase C, phosphocholine-specific [Alphaproteobacteria bacterium]
MPKIDRRGLLAGLTAAAAFPSLARALSIAPKVRTGTIQDVEHVVILMQENRSFDHYFGTMNGVRGFSDPHPAPAPGVDGRARDVLLQHDGGGEGPAWLAPFPLNTRQTFAHMRVEGTPHSWPDAQAAWDDGRMGRWPEAKHAHSMGYYERADIPFQYAMADAFTLCDAYFCSLQTGTNPNRVMLWSGCNDGSGEHGGPCIGNSHDNLPRDGGAEEPYRWTTYVERLQAAGIDWRIYQDMADNFTDNPLVGFEAFQKAVAGAPGADPALVERGLTTRALDGLKADVLAGRLPQVSYVIATASGSEHPGPSSPAQGADYTAQVIDALTADPEVWARTVLLVNFDENDGFFDHVPPPSPPSRDAAGGLKGGSTVDLAGEYHLQPSLADARLDLPEYRGRPYGLGPRVPMYVLSPWSRGGRVNSEVFDHTSVIRFLEARFGVMEPNISPWRRAVCGDLTSCLDFSGVDARPVPLPATQADAARAAALDGRTTPPTPAEPTRPHQVAGFRPACPSVYALECERETAGDRVRLSFVNTGNRAAVFHVYDRMNLEAGPRRYTVEGGQRLQDDWSTAGGVDLQVMGPDGFHRRFVGAGDEVVSARLDWRGAAPVLVLTGRGAAEVTTGAGVRSLAVDGEHRMDLAWDDANHRYDLAVEAAGWRSEFAGRG